MRLRSRNHFSTRKNRAFVGAAQRRIDSKHRLVIIIAGFAMIYLATFARLVQYGLSDPIALASIGDSTTAVASRPDIIDRNGQLLATDLRTMSLYAEPHRIVDADEAVEKLATVIPNLDWSDTPKRNCNPAPRFNG